MIMNESSIRDMETINKISVHVEMGVSLYESFTTITIDDGYEVLWAEDAYMDLGYTPLSV